MARHLRTTFLTTAAEALLTYATCLAFYLHLRASEKYARRPELLHSHPVFSRLLTLKQSLTTFENLDLALSDSESRDEESLDEVQRNGDEIGLAPGELDDLLQEASLPRQQLKRSVQFAEPPKKKRKTIRSVEEAEPAVEPRSLTLPPLKLPSSRTPTQLDAADSFGEATSLPFADAADKTSRKKSLRFHTSKIESASMRRQGARNRAIGGDDDLPYRERRKEKDDRLAKEAIKRGRGQGGDDLDDLDPDTDMKTLDDGPDEEGGFDETNDGYYNLVKQKTRAKKEQKAAEYEASRTVRR
jgi:U3 small nucleolar RNA-associated protein 3